MPSSPYRRRVEVPDWLYSEIKRRADHDHRPVSAEIARALCQHYNITPARCHEQSDLHRKRWPTL